jgi:hypothetical protein
VEARGLDDAQLRRPTDISDDPEADMRAAEGETTEEIVAFYRRSWAASDASILARPLEATGTSYAGRTVSLRWVLVHMLEETARHCGHMDLVRELIDGVTGDVDRTPAPG